MPPGELRHTLQDVAQKSVLRSQQACLHNGGRCIGLSCCTLETVLSFCRGQEGNYTVKVKNVEIPPLGLQIEDYVDCSALGDKP